MKNGGGRLVTEALGPAVGSRGFAITGRSSPGARAVGEKLVRGYEVSHCADILRLVPQAGLRKYPTRKNMVFRSLRAASL